MSAVSQAQWRIRILYDADCPLCAREVRFLEKRDRGRGRVQFENIAAPSFDPSRYGLDAGDVMARIHGVLPNGDIVEGLEVFRQTYAAVGLGWVMAPTRWPGLRRLADRAYRIFAKNRLRWTGRASACEAGSCVVPGSPTSKATSSMEIEPSGLCDEPGRLSIGGKSARVERVRS